MYRDFTELTRRAEQKARQLKQLGWGQPDGPTKYDDLPDELAPTARWVDQIGDHLAHFRQEIYQDDIDPAQAIPQAQLIAEVLAQQVVPDDLENLPDIKAVWLRSELEGDEFNREAFDGALQFYARRGEPNVFRNTDTKGRPAMRDIQALQEVARQLVRVCRGAEEFGQVPSTQIEEFVRYHWSNQPEIQGLVGLREALQEDTEHTRKRGLWEDHPLGRAILEAVGGVQHLPAEQAEWDGPDRSPHDWEQDWEDRDRGRGRSW